MGGGVDRLPVRGRGSHQRFKVFSVYGLAVRTQSWIVGRNLKVAPPNMKGNYTTRKRKTWKRATEELTVDFQNC